MNGAGPSEHVGSSNCVHHVPPAVVADWNPPSNCSGKPGKTFVRNAPSGSMKLSPKMSPNIVHVRRKIGGTGVLGKLTSPPVSTITPLPSTQKLPYESRSPLISQRPFSTGSAGTQRTGAGEPFGSSATHSPPRNSTWTRPDVVPSAPVKYDSSGTWPGCGRIRPVRPIGHASDCEPGMSESSKPVPSLLHTAVSPAM